MLSPSLLFALVLSSLYSIAFYAVFGQGWTRLILYWLVGLAGFGAGQWLASAIGLSLFSVGAVNVVEATVVSWTSLLAIRAWRR